MLKRIVPLLCCSALATACGSSGGGSSTTTSGNGAGSGSGSSSSSSSSSGGSSSGSTAFCNGATISNASGTFFVGVYPKADEIRTGCESAFAGFFDAGAFGDISGILDVDSYADGGWGTTYAIYPAGCDDIGAGNPVTTTGTIAGPAGALTIAAAISGAATAPSLYGVVTFVSAPYYTTGPHSGTIYLEDQTGGAGVSVYFSKGAAPYPDGGAGAMGSYPLGGLSRGQVISISNAKWSPFDGQTQFEFQATSVVTVLGTAALPATVPVTDSSIAENVAPVPAAVGQRVTISGPNTVINGCPF